MQKDSLSETIAVYEELGAKYVDRIARVKLPQLKEFIDMIPNKAYVLDVGCAAGRDSAILRSSGLRVTGIDLAKSFIELAEERVPGIEFQVMDARVLSFKRNTFDGIWANAILLNLDRSEIPNVLQGFWKIMKPGGIVSIGVKEGEGEKFVGEDLVDNMKRRETYFGKLEMESLFRDAGFEIKNSYVCSDKLGRSTIKWVFVSAKKRI